MTACVKKINNNNNSLLEKKEKEKKSQPPLVYHPGNKFGISDHHCRRFFWNEDLKRHRRIVSPLSKTIWSTRLQRSAYRIYTSLYRYSVQYAIQDTEQRQMYDTQHVMRGLLLSDYY